MSRCDFEIEVCFSGSRRHGNADEFPHRAIDLANRLGVDIKVSRTGIMADGDALLLCRYRVACDHPDDAVFGAWCEIIPHLEVTCDSMIEAVNSPFERKKRMGDLRLMSTVRLSDGRVLCQEVLSGARIRTWLSDMTLDEEMRLVFRQMKAIESYVRRDRDGRDNAARTGAHCFSVNLSLNLFLSDMFGCAELSRLKDIGVGVIEMPERNLVTLRDVERIKDKLSSCGAEGIKVYMDDFGAGYAHAHALEHILHVVDGVKVDVSLTRKILQDGFERSDISGHNVCWLVRESLNNGFDIVFEGVERANEVEKLKSFVEDCAGAIPNNISIQGFVFRALMHSEQETRRIRGSSDD